jgi:hypothetical protein
MKTIRTQSMQSKKCMEKSCTVIDSLWSPQAGIEEGETPENEEEGPNQMMNVGIAEKKDTGK